MNINLPTAFVRFFINRATSLRPAASATHFFSALFALAVMALSGVGACAANTANNYTGGQTASLLVTGNWSLSALPTVANDAVFTGVGNGIHPLSTANMTVGSFGVTATSSTYSIRNETSSATDRTLFLGGAGNLGNSVSGTASDLLYVASSATFALRGDNPAGTGVLKVQLGQSGSFNAAGTLNITAAISDGGGAFGFTKTGVGVLTLSGANTYGGNTTISGGTLALGASGSIDNTPQISIAAGATYDVSTITTYTLSSSTTLSASGTGTTVGTSAATIKGGTTVSLGSQTVALTFTPTGFTGDTTHPALLVSQGALTFNNNTISVNNAAASPLGRGTYRLVQVGNGTTGTINSTPNTAVSVTGSGLVAGATASIAVSSGNVNLVVKETPSITTAPTASAILFGQTLASSSLSGGVASVAGSFAFTTPSTTPGAGGIANQSVTFTPTDTANYNTVVFNVSVRVNPAPGVFALATVSNTPVSFATNKLILVASDAGVTLFISGVTSPSAQGGTVSIGGTTIIYTPAVDYFGADSFTYTLSDDVGGSSTGTVNVTVRTGNTGSTITGLVLLSDPARVVLTASGKVSTLYKVQASNDSGNTWSEIGTATSAANGVLSYTDTAPSYPTRLYRLAQ